MSFDKVIRNVDGSTELFIATFRDILAAIGSPRCVLLELMVSNRDYKSMVELTCDPLHYTCASKFRDDYFVTEFGKKYPFYTGFEPRAQAEEKDAAAEESCRITNQRFSTSPNLGFLPSASALVFYRAKRIISSILRDVDLDAVFRFSQHGPGTSSSIRGSDTSAYKKFSNPYPEVTRRALPYYEAYLRRDWLSSSYHLGADVAGDFCPLTETFVRTIFYNRLAFVPKNSKTHRSIAVEPDWNIFFQLGFGQLLRSRLRTWGINLDTQFTVNQEAAKLGSIDSSLSTIDLSSASDTVSYELVHRLLPEEWFAHLDNLRSAFTRFPDGSFRRNEKFSSMGNGYTFELETLIFYSLAHASCEIMGASLKGLSVYGDDITISSGATELLISTLQHLGFTINTHKTFTNGVFRESCGKDYFQGCDVRPVFLKNGLQTHLQVLRLANALRRYASHDGFVCDGRFEAAYNRLVRTLPKGIPLVPDGYGDCGLVVDFDRARPSLKKASFGREGYVGRALKFTPSKRRPSSYFGAVVTSLHRLGSFDKRGYYSLRERGVWHVRPATFSQWRGLGYWF